MMFVPGDRSTPAGAIENMFGTTFTLHTYLCHTIAMSVATTTGSEHVEGEHTIRMELRLRPDEMYDCPIADVDFAVDEVRYNATNGTCTVDLVTENGGVVRATDRMDEECFCTLFQKHDCVPHYEIGEDGTIFVTTYVDDRAAVSSLVRELRDVTDGIQLDRLVAIGKEGGENAAVVDLSVLTARQREALELAVARGYYRDGGTDLQTMADELDISDSALSQRLRIAHAKLVTDLFP